MTVCGRAWRNCWRSKMGGRIGTENPSATSNFQNTMKKHHGQSILDLVPELMNPNEPSTVTAGQFVGLDLWTIPRRHPFILSDVCAPTGVMIKRTSKAFRSDWSTIALPMPLAAFDLRRGAETALYGAAKVCRKAGFRITYYRRKGYIVVWTPLSRKGDITIERLNAAFTALWTEALKLSMESAKAFTVLKETEGTEK